MLFETRMARLQKLGIHTECYKTPGHCSISQSITTTPSKGKILRASLKNKYPNLSIRQKWLLGIGEKPKVTPSMDSRRRISAEGVDNKETIHQDRGQQGLDIWERDSM